MSHSAFVTFDIFTIRHFVPIGISYFRHSTFCPIRRFVLFDVLSYSTFCPFDVFYHSTYCHSTFCPIRHFVLRIFFTVGVFYFDILSVNHSPFKGVFEIVLGQQGQCNDMPCPSERTAVPLSSSQASSSEMHQELA